MRFWKVEILITKKEIWCCYNIHLFQNGTQSSLKLKYCDGFLNNYTVHTAVMG